MLTGLVLAVVMAVMQTTDPTAPADTNPAPARVTGVDVDANAPEDPRPDSARRQDRSAVICRSRAPTGSRLNQQRCRTRAEAGSTEAEAQRLLGEMTRVTGSTDAHLGPPPQ